ncbi:hypothetical protein Tco_0200426 [Tanacetum coccineum]
MKRVFATNDKLEHTEDAAARLDSWGRNRLSVIFGIFDFKVVRLLLGIIWLGSGELIEIVRHLVECRLSGGARIRRRPRNLVIGWLSFFERKHHNDLAFVSLAAGSLEEGSFSAKDGLSPVVVIIVLATTSITSWGGVLAGTQSKVMEGFPRFDELLRSTNTHKWEEVMILYFRRCIIQDSRIAMETSRLCGEVLAIVSEREHFLQELNSLPGQRVLEKMAEFL